MILDRLTSMEELRSGMMLETTTETTFLLEDFESSKFVSLIGEATNWFFPIG